NMAAEIPTEVVGIPYHHSEVVGDPYHGGMNPRPRVVRNSYPQETVLQQTDFDLSKIRKARAENVDKSPLSARQSDTNGQVTTPARSAAALAELRRGPPSAARLRPGLLPRVQRPRPPQGLGHPRPQPLADFGPVARGVHRATLRSASADQGAFGEHPEPDG